MTPSNPEMLPHGDAVEAAKAELLSTLAALIAFAKRHGEGSVLYAPDDYLDEVNDLILAATAHGRALETRQEVEKAVAGERNELFCRAHAKHWENTGICPICEAESSNLKLAEQDAEIQRLKGMTK